MQNPEYVKAVQEQLSLAAETSLLFMRSLLKTDATPGEINLLMLSYLELFVFGRTSKPEGYFKKQPPKEPDIDSD